MNRDQLINTLLGHGSLQPVAEIYHPQLGRKGVAILIGENLSKTWQSGDLIIFWDNGDQTDIERSDQVEYIQKIM